MRLEKGTWINAPWGMVASPEEFRAMGDAILMGHSAGQIAAFHPQNGKLKGLVPRNKDRSRSKACGASVSARAAMPERGTSYSL